MALIARLAQERYDMEHHLWPSSLQLAEAFCSYDVMKLRVHVQAHLSLSGQGLGYVAVKATLYDRATMEALRR